MTKIHVTFGENEHNQVHIIDDASGSFSVYVGTQDWNAVLLTSAQLVELGHVLINLGK